MRSRTNLTSATTNLLLRTHLIAEGCHFARGCLLGQLVTAGRHLPNDHDIELVVDAGDEDVRLVEVVAGGALGVVAVLVEVERERQVHLELGQLDKGALGVDEGREDGAVGAGGDEEHLDFARPEQPVERQAGVLEELEGTLLREELVELEALLADFQRAEFRKRN